MPKLSDENDTTHVAPVNKDLPRFEPSYGNAFERGFILERGQLEPGKKSVWELGSYRLLDGRAELVAVYFACPRCTKITVDTTNDWPQTCLMCPRCGRHLWIQYNDFSYDEVNKMNQEFKAKFMKRIRKVPT